MTKSGKHVQGKKRRKKSDSCSLIDVNWFHQYKLMEKFHMGNKVRFAPCHLIMTDFSILIQW